MKKTKVVPSIKKPKKTSLKSLRTRLWQLCRDITILKYGNTCFTCGRSNLTGSNRQLGHFIPNSVGGASLRYNLDNLRIQCYFCNINAGGNGAIYYKNMVEREGQEFVDNLFRLKNQIIKADEIWFKNKIKEYEEILKDLQMQNM